MLRASSVKERPMRASIALSGGDNRNMLGIACGMGAGALWGLVFLAPALVRDFSPLDLTIGRYFFYGLISVAMIAPRWRTVLPQVSRREWIGLCTISFTGNILYYILLSSAVQWGSIAMTSLVIGFLPVAVTIIGSRDRGAVPLHRLVPSLALCAAGAVCIGWQALAAPSGGQVAGGQVVGLLCAIGALLSWTGYAVGNSRWLGQLRHISAHEWNLLTGMVTGAQSLLLVPVALVLETGGHDAAAWMRLTSVSVAIALLASITGNWLWNRMNRLLPLTLVGQMILFETMFALIYGFIWEQRLPSVMEVAAFGLVVAGVLSCIAAHRRH
jgi:drug/metabolite transporter (DMT)-like permease